MENFCQDKVKLIYKCVNVMKFNAYGNFKYFIFFAEV